MNANAILENIFLGPVRLATPLVMAAKALSTLIVSNVHQGISITMISVRLILELLFSGTIHGRPTVIPHSRLAPLERYKLAHTIAQLLNISTGMVIVSFCVILLFNKSPTKVSSFVIFHALLANIFIGMAHVMQIVTHHIYRELKAVRIFATSPAQQLSF